MSKHVKDHKSQAGDGASAEQDGAEGVGTVDQARASKLQQSRETRNQLKAQMGKAVKAYSQGADLFLNAVLNMTAHEQEKKLELDVVERVKDALIDKIAEKFRESVVEVADIGKAVASRSMTVFSAIKGELSGRIQAQKELSVIQAAQMVNAAMIEKAATLEQELNDEIDNLSREKVLAIRDVLAQFNGVQDDADNPEDGKLADGLTDWAMTKLIGIPAGDAVATEEYAREAFAVFQAGVRSSMTAAEAGDAIQHRLAHPDEDAEAIEKAEGSMGKKFNANLERDKHMRQRVAATGGEE